MDEKQFPSSDPMDEKQFPSSQIEIWFSILVRKLLRTGSFTSTEDLRTRIMDFIDYFNTTMAKPFKWMFKGFPATT
ncbi:hypothetical protein N8652_03085 [bacterium]|nr:hypothetical protein [bacterium]